MSDPINEGVRDGIDGAPWPDEPDVPGAATPEPLPVDTLPAVLRDHATSVARSAQVSSDMTVLLAICGISGTSAGRVVVRVDDAWTREWVALYGAMVAPPGERKSAAYRAMLEPLRTWQTEAAARVAPRVRIAEEVADVAYRRLKSRKDAAAKGQATMEEVEADTIVLDEARRAIPVVPELLAQDATPEALVQQMAEQGGRVAVMSPEGGPLQILDGRYSDGAARLEELAQAYDGEELSPRRVGREARTVRRPALTLAVALQPSVLASVRNGRSLRGQGIYGRIAWVVPTSHVGDRVDSSEAPALDEDAAHRYARVLHRLLDIEPETEDDGTPVSVTMTLTAEAAARKREYHYRVEHAMRSGGEYASVQDAAAKVVGRAIRIAALLELAARADEGRPLYEPIGEWAMDSAVRLCEALMTHTLRAYGDMAMADRVADLRYLLDRLRELPEGTTESELRAATRGRATIDSAADVEDLIDELEERGCVRRCVQPRTGPGRPPSPTIELHPNIRETTPQRHTENTANLTKEPDRGDIRDIRYANAGNEEPEDPTDPEVWGTFEAEGSVPSTPRPSDDNPIPPDVDELLWPEVAREE